ncbi:GreA/GreB family elongation factor [Paracidovorax konjaci]|uniref:Regulator of nucleoside diphosphate kinase n=1 Tax=Paracidovorax konjaci TaxID=32040 RepID=A0A1I1SCK8_9BURK|nr:GreA/GreB family elongation factor [Paracidovorax konjaci]SFD44219.1 regulator of nucleoside diphosphate kinase [Paracidovorax konjaci]
MHAMVRGERTLTDLDFSRLSRLAGQPLPPTLCDLLATAEVTSSRSVQADVVTMYSRVELVDALTHRRQVLTLCYPRDAEPAAGFISVLSPVGSSLLGLRAGDVARWSTPLGEACAATIAAVQYQPEATGDYLT